MSKKIEELGIFSSPTGVSVPGSKAATDGRLVAGTPLGLATLGADGKVVPEQLTPVTPASIGAIATSQAGVAGGVATLDGGGKVLAEQLPSLVVTDAFVVASEAAMLALVAERGDVAIRTDLNKSFILASDSPSTLADWKELLSPTAAVASVAGKTGVVVLVKGDVGLPNVDNTSDANKPVSTAQQAALDAKAPLTGVGLPFSISLALSDLTTAIATGTNKAYFRPSFAATGVSCRASLLVASSSGIPTIDMNKNGATMMTANKLTIDASEKTSVTAATPVGMTTTTWAIDDEIAFDIDVAGTGAKGLIVTVTGLRA